MLLKISAIFPLTQNFSLDKTDPIVKNYALHVISVMLVLYSNLNIQHQINNACMKLAL